MEETKMANLCKNCGTVLDDSVPFCSACGTPVPQQGQQFPQQGQQFPQQGQQFPQQGQQFPQQGQQFPQQGQQFPQQGQQFPQQGQQFPQQEQQFPQQGQQFPQQGQQFPQQGQQFPQQGQQFPQQGQQFPQQGAQFQQQGQQFPQQGPPPGEPPKKGLSKNLMIIIGAAAVVVIGVVIALIVILGGNNYDSEEFFEVGGDKVPSVMNVIGEKRKISGVTISSSKSADKMVVEYSVSDNQGDEMEEYAAALVKDFDFIALDEYDFSGKRGGGFQFVKVSDEDDDHIVMVTIDFNNSGYKLTIERREGELNIGSAGNNDDDNNGGDDNNNGGDDDVNNGGGDDDNNGGDDDDDNNGGDDADATPPPDDEPKEDLVEVICPAPLLGKSVEDAMANAPAGVTVVSMSSDNKSFTLELTEERRQQLIVESRELTKGIIKAILDTTPGVEEIYFVEERFEEIRMIVNADFEKDENSEKKWQAVGALAFNGPMTQVWLGTGMNTLVDVQWFEGEDAETYWSVKSPDCYFN